MPILLIVFYCAILGACFSSVARAKSQIAQEIWHAPASVPVHLRWRQSEVDFVEISIASQDFKGTQWHHVLTIARPKGLKSAHVGLVTVSGGEAADARRILSKQSLTSPALMARLLSQAKSGGIVAASIQQVPFQPIFSGKREDEAIAYSFTQFFVTGEKSWPLLQPMVKSVSKGLDAIQIFAESEWGLKLRDFVVTGESKRGWTTWLAAAHDQRIKAIAPQVFDILNVRPQLHHQIASWGAYSEQIGDYSDQGLPKMLGTPQGAELLSIIDPYEYRDRLKMPKLIILATNDPYWPVDAASLYFPGLSGPKYLLHVPNAKHEIPDTETIDQNLIALTLASEGRLHLPHIETDFVVHGDAHRATIHLKSSVLPKLTTLWQAKSKSRDFRQALWSEVSSLKNAFETKVEIEADPTRYVASFVREVFDLKGKHFTVTSALGVLEPAHS